MGWILSSASPTAEVYPTALVDLDSGWGQNVGESNSFANEGIAPVEVLTPLFSKTLPPK